MRTSLAIVVLCSLALSAGASADHLDPQGRIRSADQSRAAAMLLRESDLGAGFSVERTSGLDPHVTCEALDESDLVVTGRAKSPYWSREYQIVGLTVAVYRTAADATASWRRGTSTAGMKCLRDEFRRALESQGERLRVTARRMPFPRLAAGSAAIRLVISGVAARSPAVYIDLVVLRRGRAQAGLLFAGVVAPPPRAAETGLARVVAGRMARAMRS
jgi:hypothetical protein